MPEVLQEFSPALVWLNAGTIKEFNLNSEYKNRTQRGKYTASSSSMEDPRAVWHHQNHVIQQTPAAQLPHDPDMDGLRKTK